MNSVANDLRAATRARILAMPPGDRIALALALGDDDLERFVQASGLARTEALHRLQASRQRGRTPSRCAGPDRP